MKTLLLILLQAVLVIMLADFLAGVVHWFEDAYVREDTALIGSWIGKANVIHHHFPRYMTRNSWWQSSWDLVCLNGLVVVGAWLLALLNWRVWLFAAIGANANQVHKWSHQTAAENGRLITLLQKMKILQTPRHHAEHHTNPKDVRYCPITNLVNPLLDGIQFWAGCEWLLARMVGLKRRVDTSLPGHGPLPRWIEEMRGQALVRRAHA